MTEKSKIALLNPHTQIDKKGKEAHQFTSFDHSNILLQFLMVRMFACPILLIEDLLFFQTEVGSTKHTNIDCPLFYLLVPFTREAF